MIFGRRHILAFGGAAGLMALSGCASGNATRRSKPTLSEQITIRSFSVSTAGAGNVIGDYTESIGKDRIGRELESALNANLAGFGRGPQTIDVSVKVEFVSIAKTLLGESYLQTQVSGINGPALLIGRLRAEAAGPRQRSAEAEFRNLLAGYVSEMRQMLNNN